MTDREEIDRLYAGLVKSFESACVALANDRSKFALDDDSASVMLSTLAMREAVEHLYGMVLLGFSTRSVEYEPLLHLTGCETYGELCERHPELPLTERLIREAQESGEPASAEFDRRTITVTPNEDGTVNLRKGK